MHTIHAINLYIYNIVTNSDLLLIRINQYRKIMGKIVSCCQFSDHCILYMLDSDDNKYLDPR